jgi:hypothetical protein
MNYLIFDINKSLLSEDIIIEANNSREAVMKYLKHNNFKRSGSDYAEIQASPFKYNNNGYKISCGKCVWYKIKIALNNMV